MNKLENYAHFSSTLISLFSLSRKHETKNKHRERRVEEATNLWCTWMGEILTNLGGNGQHLPLTRHEREEELGQMKWSGWGRRSAWLIRGKLVPASGFSRH